MSRNRDKEFAQAVGYLYWGPIGSLVAGSYFPDNASTGAYNSKASGRSSPPESYTSSGSSSSHTYSYKEPALEPPMLEEIQTLMQKRIAALRKYTRTNDGRYTPQVEGQAPETMGDVLAYLKSHNISLETSSLRVSTDSGNYHKEHRFLTQAGQNIAEAGKHLSHIAQKQSETKIVNQKTAAFHRDPSQARDDEKARQKAVEVDFIPKLGEFLSVVERNRLINIAYLEAANYSPDCLPDSMSSIMHQTDKTDYREVDRELERERHLHRVIKSIEQATQILNNLAPFWMKSTKSKTIPVYDSQDKEITDLKDFAPFNKASHYECDTPLENRHYNGYDKKDLIRKMEDLYKEPDRLAEALTARETNKKPHQWVESAIIYMQEHSGLSADEQKAKFIELRSALNDRLDLMKERNTDTENKDKYTDKELRRAEMAIEMIDELAIKPLARGVDTLETTPQRNVKGGFSL